MSLPMKHVLGCFNRGQECSHGLLFLQSLPHEGKLARKGQSPQPNRWGRRPGYPAPRHPLLLSAEPLSHARYEHPLHCLLPKLSRRIAKFIHLAFGLVRWLRYPCPLPAGSARTASNLSYCSLSHSATSDHSTSSSRVQRRWTDTDMPFSLFFSRLPSTS